MAEVAGAATVGAGTAGAEARSAGAQINFNIDNVLGEKSGLMNTAKFFASIYPPARLAIEGLQKAVTHRENGQQVIIDIAHYCSRIAGAISTGGMSEIVIGVGQSLWQVGKNWQHAGTALGVGLATAGISCFVGSEARDAIMSLTQNGYTAAWAGMAGRQLATEAIFAGAKRIDKSDTWQRSMEGARAASAGFAMVGVGDTLGDWAKAHVGPTLEDIRLEIADVTNQATESVRQLQWYQDARTFVTQSPPVRFMGDVIQTGHGWMDRLLGGRTVEEAINEVGRDTSITASEQLDQLQRGVLGEVIKTEYMQLGRNVTDFRENNTTSDDTNNAPRFQGKAGLHSPEYQGNNPNIPDEVAARDIEEIKAMLKNPDIIRYVDGSEGLRAPDPNTINALSDVVSSTFVDALDNFANQNFDPGNPVYDSAKVIPFNFDIPGLNGRPDIHVQTDLPSVKEYWDWYNGGLGPGFVNTSGNDISYGEFVEASIKAAIRNEYLEVTKLTDNYQAPLDNPQEFPASLDGMYQSLGLSGVTDAHSASPLQGEAALMRASIQYNALEAILPTDTITGFVPSLDPTNPFNIGNPNVDTIAEHIMGGLWDKTNGLQSNYVSNERTDITNEQRVDAFRGLMDNLNASQNPQDGTYSVNAPDIRTSTDILNTTNTTYSNLMQNFWMQHITAQDQFDVRVVMPGYNSGADINVLVPISIQDYAASNNDPNWLNYSARTGDSTFSNYAYFKVVEAIQNEPTSAGGIAGLTSDIDTYFNSHVGIGQEGADIMKANLKVQIMESFMGTGNIGLYVGQQEMAQLENDPDNTGNNTALTVSDYIFMHLTDRDATAAALEAAGYESKITSTSAGTSAPGASGPQSGATGQSGTGTTGSTPPLETLDVAIAGRQFLDIWNGTTNITANYTPQQQELLNNIASNWIQETIDYTNGTNNSAGLNGFVILNGDYGHGVHTIVIGQPSPVVFNSLYNPANPDPGVLYLSENPIIHIAPNGSAITAYNSDFDGDGRTTTEDLINILQGRGFTPEEIKQTIPEIGARAAVEAEALHQSAGLLRTMGTQNIGDRFVIPTGAFDNPEPFYLEKDGNEYVVYHLYNGNREELSRTADPANLANELNNTTRFVQICPGGVTNLQFFNAISQIGAFDNVSPVFTTSEAIVDTSVYPIDVSPNPQVNNVIEAINIDFANQLNNDPTGIGQQILEPDNWFDRPNSQELPYNPDLSSGSTVVTNSNGTVNRDGSINVLNVTVPNPIGGAVRFGDALFSPILDQMPGIVDNTTQNVSRMANAVSVYENQAWQNFRNNTDPVAFPREIEGITIPIIGGAHPIAAASNFVEWVSKTFNEALFQPTLNLGQSAVGVADSVVTSVAGGIKEVGQSVVNMNGDVNANSTPTTILTGATYTVQPGDSMSEIAARSGIPLQTLIGLNPQIANPSLIYAGQEINLGGTSITGTIENAANQAGEALQNTVNNAPVQTTAGDKITLAVENAEFTPGPILGTAMAAGTIGILAHPVANATKFKDFTINTFASTFAWGSGQRPASTAAKVASVLLNITVPPILGFNLLQMAGGAIVKAITPPKKEEKK